MASITDVVDDRFVALLEQAAGARYPLPAGLFRRSAQRVSLRDPNYPGTWADRAYHLHYASSADHEPELANPNDASWRLDLGVELEVGYVAGDAAASGWNPSAAGSGETAAYAVRNPSARAVNEAQLVWRTLNAEFPAAAVVAGVALIDCRRTGPATVADLGGGRVVCVTPLVVWVEVAAATQFLPSR